MNGMKVPTNVSIVWSGERKLGVEGTLPRDGTSCLSLLVWAYRWSEVSLDGVVSPDAWIERSEYSEPVVSPQPLYIPRRQAEVAYAKTCYTSTTFLREARKSTTHTGAGGAHFCLWYELAGWLVDTVPGGGIHRALPPSTRLDLAEKSTDPRDPKARARLSVNWFPLCRTPSDTPSTEIDRRRVVCCRFTYTNAQIPGRVGTSHDPPREPCHGCGARTPAAEWVAACGRNNCDTIRRCYQ